MSSKQISRGWKKFWTAPASPLPLAVLRIGVAAILAVQAYWVAPQFFDLYGSDGILQGTLRGQFGSSDLPGIYELAHWLQGLGVAETHTLAAIGALYFLGVLGLLLGFHTRVAAVITWATHFALAGGNASSYGLDTFVNITLFYFLWMPIGAAYSWDAFTGRVSSAPSPEARWSLRILQLHLSIAYLACGLDKALGYQWWNGESIWRSLMMPFYAQFDASWMAKVPGIARLAGWGTLIVECGYAVAMWIPRLRKFWLMAVIGLHLGIFALMGLHLFALMMIVLSVSAFGVADVPIAERRPEELVGFPLNQGETGLVGMR